MTNFSAGQQQQSGPEKDKIKFIPGGETGNQQTGADDQTVILKYGDREFTEKDILEKFQHGDQHIQNLNGKLDEYNGVLKEVNETLKTQFNAADLLEKIQSGQAKGANVTNNDPPANGQSADPNAQTAQPPTKEEILEELRKERDEEAQKQASEQNFNRCAKVLSEAYGEKVNDKVAEVAKSVGITVEQAADMARRTPDVFLRLFPDAGESQQRQSTFSEAGRVNSQALGAKPDDKVGGVKDLFNARTAKERIQLHQQRLKQLGIE